MPIRRIAIKTVALLALSAMPLTAAATGVATSVVLIITTPSTIYYGEDVSGYAQVNSGDGSTLTGTVTFYDGTLNICTIPVNQTTSCPPSTGTGFAVGTHMLAAIYSGDATHPGSTSNAVPITVVPDATTVSLASSADPAVYGQNIVLTATASADHATPSGPVTFLDGGTVLGTATLNGTGLAGFSTASLGEGSHTITATYPGDVKTAAGSSASLAEVVSAAATTGQNPFSLTVAGSAAVDAGSAANLLVTVAPQTGSIQPVQLSCAGLPPESTCTFGTATLPVNGGTTSLQISTMAPHSCESATPSSQSAGMPLGGGAVAGLTMLFIPRRRRKALKGLLLAVVAVCGLVNLTGCGNCTDLGTRPGDYTIRVIGTSMGTATDVVITKIVLHVTVPRSGS